MDKLELGKKYVIKAGTPVWSIDLQKKISFCDDCVVEPNHTFLDKVYFGIIIDHSNYGADYYTQNEIEFGPDAVSHEYVKKNKGNLLDYWYDYNYIVI